MDHDIILLEDIMKTQNYKNHAQIVPGYHYFTLTVALLILIGSIVNTYKSYTQDTGIYSASLILVMAVVLIFATVYARSFSLRAQDRIIRLEEEIRHQRLTGKSLPHELKIRQIIGLRFAEDEEFLSLIDKAIKEDLTEKQIKQAVTQWREDHYRV